MNITKTKTYATDDGKLHASLADAQIHSLASIFGDLAHDAKAGGIAEFVWKRAEDIQPFLPKKPRKARKAAVKPAKVKAVKTGEAA